MQHLKKSQLDFLNNLEKEYNKVKTKLSNIDKRFLEGVFARVKQFGLRTILSDYERNKIRSIAEKVKSNDK